MDSVGGNGLIVQAFGGTNHGANLIYELNVWKHLTLKLEKIGSNCKMSVYINGVFNANNGANGYGAWTSVGLTGLTMGALGASSFGNVKLDDVRVYNVALTDAQILELYKGRVSFINFISPTSGGSGGGSYMNSTGASAGTVWNATYSKVNAGLSSTTTGGNGGSALSNGGVISSINGSAYTYGTGGSATVINSTKKYGDGADYTGNAGNGIVIIKIPYVLPYTIVTLTDIPFQVKIVLVCLNLPPIP